MNAIKFVCIMLLLFITVTSCDNNSKSTALLQQATKTMEDNPKQALALLDSIKNPEAMDKGNYMKYIVANTQARYKNYIDVTADTLIFEAEKYFRDRSDHNQAALAHYYAANIQIDRGNEIDGLTSLLNAEHRAKQADNKLLVAKSQHSIGNSYSKQNTDTIAIQYYLKALKQYEQLDNVNEYQLQLFRILGISYNKIGQLDSSNLFYQRGLKLAIEDGDNSYQMYFYKHFGVLEWSKNEYNQAVANLNKAITLSLTKTDSTRIFLNLAKVYNSKHRLDSAKYYTDLVVDGMVIEKDRLVLRTMCGALADYNTQIGNITEARYYSELWHVQDKEIIKANSADVLLKAHQNFQLTILQKEAEAKHIFTLLFAGLLAFVFLTIGLILYFRLRAMAYRNQQDADKIKLLESNADCQKTKMQGMMDFQSTIQNAVPQWRSIQKKVEELSEEYGAKEKPELYRQIEQLVDELIHNSEEQRTKWAKDYLKKYPFDDKLIDKLKTNQQLLLVLCCCSFSKQHIASLMGIKESKVYPNQLEIKHILLKEGYTCEHIEQFLFTS